LDTKDSQDQWAIAKLTNYARTVLSFARFVKLSTPAQRLQFFLACAIGACCALVPIFLKTGSYTLKWASLALVAGAIICFLWLLRRIVPPVFYSPSLKPYSDTDGELFVELERGSEIVQCVGFLEDSQISLIAIHGATGIGKTSVLRAGIQYRFLRRSADSNDSKGQTGDCIYWRADPSSESVSLIKAIEHSIGDVHGNNPLDIVNLVKSRLVIIVDQFERLDRSSPDNALIFDLIRRVHASSAPHKVQLVIAFDSDYLPEWLSFEQDAGIQAQKIAIQAFTMPQALRVINVLAIRAGITISNKILAHYVRDIANDGRVSPLDIAVGLVAFLAWNQQVDRVSIRDYRRAGGVQAVWSTHLQEQLGPAHIRPQDRERLIQAVLITLVDRETRRRKKEGGTKDEIARVAGLDIHAITSYLKSLEAGYVLLSVHAQNVYTLSRDQLAAALQDHVFMVAGDGIVRATSIGKSERARKLRLFRYPALGAALGAVLIVIAFGAQAAFRWQHTRKIAAEHSALINFQRNTVINSKLHPDLFDAQSNFESISIDTKDLKTLEWLYSPHLTELKLRSPGLVSLHGLEAVSALESLDIDLKDVSLTDLQEISALQQLRTLILRGIGHAKNKLSVSALNLRELRTLDLDFEGTKITSLPDLSTLLNLENLTLNLKSTDIDQLPDLSMLPRLQCVRVLLDHSKIQNLTPLAKLDHLQYLTLSLDPGQIKSVADLRTSQAVFDLTLYLGSYPFTKLPGLDRITGLQGLSLHMPSTVNTSVPDLSNLKHLQRLSIFVSGSDLRALPKIKVLKRLHVVNLGLESSAIIRLPDMSGMKEVERLAFNTNSTSIQALPTFPNPTDRKNVDEINLCLRNSDILSLEGIKEFPNLRTLSMELGGSQIQDLNFLTRLTNLRTLILHIGWSQAHKLPTFSNLSSLHRLELHLEGQAELEELPDFSGAKGLTELSLFLPNSNLQHLPELSSFANLKKLTITLVNATIPDLSAITEARNLQELSLDLRESSIPAVPSFSELKFLQKVSIDLRHSRLRDSAGLNGMSKLQELKVDDSMPFLNRIPSSVKRVSVGAFQFSADQRCSEDFYDLECQR
jgi:hypothetical protein